MAIIPFVSNIEMNKNIIYNACFHSDNEPPANPEDGQYYLNKSDNRVYFYRSSDKKWHKIGDGIIYTGGNGIEISPTYVISIRDEILEQINKGTQDIVDIKKDIDTISDTIVTMQQDITINKTNISNAQKDISNINSEIVTINTNINDLQEQIITLGNRVSDDERKISNNTNEITLLKNRMNEAESDIQDNANNISSLDKRVTTNEGDISNLKSELKDTNSNVTNLQKSKLDKDFTSSLLTDISIERKSVTDVLIKETSINPATRVISTTNNLLPLADTVNSGLATAEMVNTITENKERIKALEQQGGRYIGQSFATLADLRNFKIPDSVNVGDFTYVIDDEEHKEATTRYVVILNGSNEKEFSFAYVIEYDPIGSFTQTNSGLIIGKEKDGYVYAETDGSGSVYGWNSLKSKVEANTLSLSSLTNSFNDFVSTDHKEVVDRISAAEVEIENSKQDISNLQDNKADKNKLQSIVTDVSLKISADSNKKNNVISLVEKTYNSLTDSNLSTDIRIPLVTSDSAGLMSIQDKTKLDTIADGAEVNQKAYSYMKIGENVIGAENKTDIFEFEAGDGISLTSEPENKKLIINSTVKPIYTTANWQEKGLQSAYDKEREDKMGEEVWEAVMDKDGNYTIDLKDFEGYVGKESHLYVRFMQQNTTKNPKLTIKSTTADYVLVDSLPLKKSGLVDMNKKFISEQSVWEVIYMPDDYFCLVATSGDGGITGDFGYNNLETLGYVELISGVIGKNKSQTFAINISSFSNDSKSKWGSCSGSLFISLSSGNTSISEIESKVFWMSKSNQFPDFNENDYLPVSGCYTFLDDNLVGISIDGLKWSLFINRKDSKAIYEYRIEDAIVNDGEEPEVELQSNKMCDKFSSSSKQIISKNNTIMSTNGSHSVDSIISLTSEEFENLKTEKKIIPGMMYNIIDDQTENQQMIVTVPNYNTFNPLLLGVETGGTVNVKASANANFAVNSKASTGLLLCGEETYMLICQEENNKVGKIYTRTYLNGSWGNWKSIATDQDISDFIKCSDGSVKTIVTITQEEYDNLLLSGKVDDKTMYNVVNENGTVVVSRINEYTSVTQIGLVEETNMDVNKIIKAMPSNSVLYTELSTKFTLAGLSLTSGLVEVVKKSANNYYVKITDNNGLDNVYVDGAFKSSIVYNNSTGESGVIKFSTNNFGSHFRIYYRPEVSGKLSPLPSQSADINLNIDNTSYLSGIYENDSGTGTRFISEIIKINKNNDNNFTVFRDVTKSGSGGNVSESKTGKFYIYAIEQY